MAYIVRVLPEPALALEALPKLDRRNLRDRIEKLADDPRPSDSKPLVGALLGQRRIASGDYRAIYRVNEPAAVVTVVDVGHRSTVYK